MAPCNVRKLFERSPTGVVFWSSSWQMLGYCLKMGCYRSQWRNCE